MSVDNAAELAAFIESQFAVLDELKEFLDSVMAIRDDAERERSDGLVVASIVEAYTFERLDELRRFRHFKRYYYRLDYDWDKFD